MKLFKKLFAFIFVLNIIFSSSNITFAQYNYDDNYDGGDYGGSDYDYDYGGYNDCYGCDDYSSGSSYNYDNYYDDGDYGGSDYDYNYGGYNDCYGCESYGSGSSYNYNDNYDGGDYGGSDYDYDYGGYNDCYNCGTYSGNSGTYYGNSGNSGTYYGNSGTYYGNSGTYYGNNTTYTPVSCPNGYHLSGSNCVEDTKYCNGRYIPVYQACTTTYNPPEVRCADGSYVTNASQCPQQVTCTYPYIRSGNSCVIQTQNCPNGAVIPVNQSCPAQTRQCPNGQVVPINQSCPTQTTTCPDGTVIISGQACPTPTRQCPNGQVLPVTQVCPAQTQTCFDGSVIPVTQNCPPQYKTCADGRVVLISQNCGKYCSNGVFVQEGTVCTRICPNGQTYPENVACPIIENRPNVNLSVSKNLVNRGEQVILSWVSTNATSCSASNAWSGSKATTGSEVRYSLQGNSTYVITCYNSRGESASDTVFVNVRDLPNINISRVVTTVPTKIGQSVATCNGIGVIANNLQTTAWFEYGTSEALGNKTNIGNIGSDVTTPFSNTITGLKSSTKYYCRAVIANAQGTFKGELMSFTTTGKAVVYVPPVKTPTTPTKNPPKKEILVCYDEAGNKDDTLNTKKAVEVSVEKYSGSLTEGSLVEYRVKYANTSKITVSNVTLKLSLPKELQYVNSTRGDWNSEKSELSVNLGDVKSNENGEVLLRAKVADKIETGKTVVVTAYVSYEVLDSNKNKLRDEVVAFAISTLGEKSPTTNADTYDKENDTQNNNSASSFLPDSILEWLAIIALIMILIFLGKRIKDEFDGKDKSHDHGHH